MVKLLTVPVLGSGTAMLFLIGDLPMKDKVAIFDTTLRDGEQAAGTRLGSREKLTLARQLSRLNVDVIEAGYPASSPEDFESVRLLAKEIDNATICAL